MAVRLGARPARRTIRSAGVAWSEQGDGDAPGGTAYSASSSGQAGTLERQRRAAAANRVHRSRSHRPLGVEDPSRERGASDGTASAAAGPPHRPVANSSSRKPLAQRPPTAHSRRPGEPLTRSGHESAPLTSITAYRENRLLPYG